MRRSRAMVMCFVTRALALIKALPRALYGPTGVIPSSLKIRRKPFAFGFGARYWVYGRAVAAVNEGATSKPNRSGTTPATVTRCRSSTLVGPHSYGGSMGHPNDVHVVGTTRSPCVVKYIDPSVPRAQASV